MAMLNYQRVYETPLKWSPIYGYIRCKAPYIPYRPWLLWGDEEGLDVNHLEGRPSRKKVTSQHPLLDEPFLDLRVPESCVYSVIHGPFGRQSCRLPDVKFEKKRVHSSIRPDIFCF